MALTMYDKLVRDRIPEIIAENGGTPHVLALSGEEYRKRLRQKLREEMEEYLVSGETEELADLLEVMHALAASDGISWDEVEAVRKNKAQERGAFSRGLLLLSVEK